MSHWILFYKNHSFLLFYTKHNMRAHRVTGKNASWDSKESICIKGSKRETEKKKMKCSEIEEEKTMKFASGIGI